MLQPSNTKYRKQQKGRNHRRFATKGNFLAFGEYGIKTLECAKISSKQIEAARIAISRYIKRGGKIWIRLFPDRPVTKKPIEVRQGKGKGNVEFWVDAVNPGKVLFEVSGISKDVAKEALRLASSKLPIKTMFISREMVF